jgi:hypothetical protein
VEAQDAMPEQGLLGDRPVGPGEEAETYDLVRVPITGSGRED